MENSNVYILSLCEEPLKPCLLLGHIWQLLATVVYHDRDLRSFSFHQTASLHLLDASYSFSLTFFPGQETTFHFLLPWDRLSSASELTPALLRDSWRCCWAAGDSPFVGHSTSLPQLKHPLEIPSVEGSVAKCTCNPSAWRLTRQGKQEFKASLGWREIAPNIGLLCDSVQRV